MRVSCRAAEGHLDRRIANNVVTCQDFRRNGNKMFDYEISESHKMRFTNIETSAENSLARTWKETSYSYQELQPYTKA